jgi:hypothetical protein
VPKSGFEGALYAIEGLIELVFTSAGNRERVASWIAVVSAPVGQGRTAADRAPSRAAFCTDVYTNRA